MEEGTTNQEAHMDEISAVPPCSEPEAGSQPNTEATINPNALEYAIQNALKNFLPRLESTTNARAEFYNRFKREADEYDNDFLRKYRGDLETTLIFAGLFSTVASAFIVAIQIQLQPDYTQLSYDFLWTVAESNGLNVPDNLYKPNNGSPWTGPDPALVKVQAILFSSLAASLLAAFGAMLGKQWLNRYSQVEMHGSLIKRGRDRQRKMSGMATWRFKFVMECLPLMLQGALLLLGCALSKYLFTVDTLIAWVVFGFTASGLLFYMIINIAAITFYDCPYQTPLSLIIRFMVRRSRRWFSHTVREWRWFLRTALQEWRQRRRQTRGSDDFADLELVNGMKSHRIEVPHPPVLFDHINRRGYVLDSKCVAWMFEMSMDPDVILDVMTFIPEIIWHDGIKTTPFEILYDTVLKCFDFDYSPNEPVLIPKFKDQAYLGAKALLHLAIQRKCIGNESDVAGFNRILRWHPTIGSRRPLGGSDLEYTLCMVDCVLGHNDFESLDLEGFKFTSTHYAWMAHILPYRAWYFIKNDKALPSDISEFLRRSFLQETPPSTPIMLSCLLIIGLTSGVRSDYDHDPLAIDVDEGQKLRSRINTVYPTLVEVFRNTGSTAIPMNCAFGILKFAIPLLENKYEVTTKSYELFLIIMRDITSSTLTQEQILEASRLALHGAYGSDKHLPPVGDPQPILDFLIHHFELVESGENHDEPIQNALRALAYASTIKALKNFDPTQLPAFVHGICHVFQKERPLRLRRAALFFLPLIADKWFYPPLPIMEDHEMGALCANWASAVDEVWRDDHVKGPTLAVFLDMINSPHWCPHVVPEKWNLLAYLDSVPEDSQPLARCLRNPGLADAITTVGGTGAVVPWLKALLLKYNQLDPEVRKGLEASMMKDTQRGRINDYLSMMQQELMDTEDKLLYGTWFNDPRAAALGGKIKSHEAAIAFLREVERSNR